MPTRINSISQLKGLSDKRSCLVATVGNIAFTGITQIDILKQEIINLKTK